MFTRFTERVVSPSISQILLFIGPSRSTQKINAVAAEVIVNDMPILVASVYIPPDKFFERAFLNILLNKRPLFCWVI